VGEELLEELRQLGLRRGDGHDLFVRVPDDVEAGRDGQGAGAQAQLDLVADLGLLLLGHELLALFAHGLHGLVHGHEEVLLHDRRGDAPGVQAQGEGQVGAFFRGAEGEIGVEHVVEGDPAEAALLGAAVDVAEGVAFEPVLDLVPQGRGDVLLDDAVAGEADAG
jgi:hypothetical protein